MPQQEELDLDEVQEGDGIRFRYQSATGSGVAGAYKETGGLVTKVTDWYLDFAPDTGELAHHGTVPIVRVYLDSRVMYYRHPHRGNEDQSKVGQRATAKPY